MRPPIAYYGGKSGMAPRLAALLGPHRVYLEPFFGSGAVLFAKQPAQHEIINDADGVVVNFFRCLRDRRDELEAACALTPHARDEFNGADLDADVDDIERARRFWVRINQSFAKTAGRQTGFSVTTGRTQSVPGSILTRLGRFEDCARRLLAVTIENCDGTDLITRLATPDASIYVDPPYLASTRRTGRKGDTCRDYRVDMADTTEHERLAQVLHATKATVVLSGYDSELYNSLYDGWTRIEHIVAAHSSHAIAVPSRRRGSDRRAAVGRATRTEVIWVNRPVDEGRLFTSH